MTPFQAAVPGAGGSNTPGALDENLWASSRSGRAAGQPMAGRRAAERLEAERREVERLEAERLEAARLDAARLEAERREAERLEAERREAERVEAERRAARQREAERLASERREAERREAEERAARQRQADWLAAERREAEARTAQVPTGAPGDLGGAPDGPDDDRSAPWSTGPAGSRPGLPGAARPVGPAPSSNGPAYGDWTRPSRSGTGDTGGARQVPDPEEDYSSQRFARLRAGAPTEATEIPEREFAGRQLDDEYRPAADEDDHDDEPTGLEREPMTGSGPVTDPGSVTGTMGGRAAFRAERQAAEAARKAARKKAARGTRAEATTDGGRRRSPRRAVLGLVAVAIVALGVLGVYSYASPHTQQAAAQAPAATPSAGAALGTVPGVSDLPPLSTVPAPTPTVPAAPVRVPVTVLNSTNVTGLAASIAAKIKGAGWQTLPVGQYGNTDVATTTVYFTKGNEKQRQSALQLIAKFPQLHGPAVRFFGVPASASGGLVVVATGDWKP